MPSSTVCWGIEIGAAAIKAIKLESDGPRVNILDVVVVEHPKVLSTPGVDANDVLRVSLGQFISQVNLSGASIAVSVPGHSAFARFAKLPPVEPKKVPEIVKFEALQQIPFPLEQVEWDYQTFISPDSPDVEVGIFAITRDRIMERLNLLNDVGITPDYVTLSPIAVFNAMAFDLQFDTKTPGTIMVDVGTTSTDLVVSEAGRVWVRTFPLGGHQFTEALVQAFQIGYPKADKLKQEAEDSKHARQVFQAMRPVFTDLGQDIQRSIGYYQSLHKDANLSRLIGLGSTFQLPGLRKYLKQQLSIDVFRLEEFKRASLEQLPGGVDGDKAKLLKSGTIGLATAYGLALQGAGLGTINANLMPVQVIRASMWKGKTKWFATAAGIAVAAAGAMFIRPTLDTLAISGKPAPAVIAAAVNQAKGLKGDAEKAGVVGSATPDLRAANLVALLDHRDLHALIVDDLGAMLEDAASKAAKPEEAFTLKSFNTTYVGPRDPNANPEGNSGAAPADPNDPLAGKARIYVTMGVSTTAADPQKYALNSVQAWLEAHKQRTGRPYVLKFKSPAYVLGEASVTGIPAASGPEASPEQPSEDPRESRGGRRGGRAAGGPAAAPPPPSGGMNGGNPPPSAGGEAGGGGENFAELTNLAPFANLKPKEPAGVKKQVLTFTWEVVIAPPEPKADEQGAANGTANKEGGK
ncbi:MAG: type IV pilus assembly protein PilM [Planctomycetota bacterium]|nr:type IV pilus assembly protein PilM [Planctomycetota bacterium]